MRGFQGEWQNLEINVVFNREPVTLLKNRSDMYVQWKDCSDDMSGYILNHLKFIKRLERETKDNRIAIVSMGYNQGVNNNSGVVRCK